MKIACVILSNNDLKWYCEGRKIDTVAREKSSDFGAFHQCNVSTFHLTINTSQCKKNSNTFWSGFCVVIILCGKRISMRNTDKNEKYFLLFCANKQGSSRTIANYLKRKIFVH